MKAVELTAIRLLKEAKKHGEVAIITNANQMWLDFCKEHICSTLFAYLKKCNIVVFSARQQFENAFPRDPITWKIKSFRCITHRYCQVYSRLPTTLVSVGDGVHEKHALVVVAKEFGISYKNLQYLHSPSTSQLMYQLRRTITNIHSFMSMSDKGNKLYEMGVEKNGLYLIKKCTAEHLCNFEQFCAKNFTIEKTTVGLEEKDGVYFPSVI